jgi:hypothetical protein
MDSILSKLKVVANSVYVQQGDLTENRTGEILQEMYDETKQRVGKADNLVIVERNGVITFIAADQERHRSGVGRDVSCREYANQPKTTVKHGFSTGFMARVGT